MARWQRSLAALLTGAGIAAFAGGASAAENTIIVLDASGSMWAQIEGDHKITIAREVLGSVLDEIPADQSLGFMAYGHRKKGVCSDIELLVPPGPGTAGQIREAAGKLNPKGKTPLTDAVRQAAEALRYTEDAATVVLITDGLETCDADPCALGRALEESGVAFTAHVVGFGLKEGEGAQVACLAEETGGRYLDAANASELTEALTQTVAAPPPEPEESATVAAPAEIPAGANFEVAWEGPGNEGDYITIVELGTPEDQHGNHAFVREGNPLVVRAPDGLGAYEVRYLSGKTGKPIGRTAVTLTPIEASLEAPYEVAAGGEFEVAWSGPGYQDDFLTIVEAGAPEGSDASFAYARDGSPSPLSAPEALGNYEVRYVVGQSKRTLASHPIIVFAVGATLEAPESVAAGSRFEVAWDGPDNRNDFITIVEAGAPEGTFASYEYTRHGSPLTLEAPDALGAYEIRYVLGGSKATLASRPITLLAVEASLTAPAEVAAGSRFEVTWEGPDNPGDFVTIVETGAPEGSFASYGYTRHGSPAKLVAADAVGEHEIRYVMGKSKRTLASVPVTLVSVSASLEAPAEVSAGASFEVAWEGPDNPNDYITIVEAGAPEGSHLSYDYSRKGSPVKLRAPDAVGDYELRYVVGKSKRTLASRPVTLVAVAASVEAPAEVQAGSDFTVSWSGPNNPNDYISIAEVGAPEGKYLTYAYTRKGSPAKLRAPDQVGKVEIRYVMGQSKRTLASETIALTPVSANLRVTNTVVPEGQAIVEWQGPNLANDYIALAEPGAPEGKYLAYAYTRRGNPATIKVPKVLGNFEIRYVIGQSKRTLAAIPVLIDIAKVTLEAPKAVKAGGTLQVAWSGPGNWEDFIEIVPAGAAADAKPLTATRTSQGSPLPIFAPAQPGEYEVRYKMRGTGEVASAIPLTVE